MNLTKEQVEARTSDYICWTCGSQFLTKEQRSEKFNVVTAHLGICGLCNKPETVIHKRHWNHLQIEKNEAI